MNDNIHETEDAFVKELKAKTKNPDLLALTEEVSERRHKPTNNPTSVPKKLAQGDFNSAMIHFYRGEVQRSNTWRKRLDATTNWAVITAGATLSFVFSSPNSPHFAIPINSILVTIFLFMEARRYRFYEVWANRVRVMETGYFGPMLSHRSISPDKQWAEHLSGDLLDPHFTITEWEAVGRRLRANYIWIFVLLALSWTLKIYLHPVPALHLEEFLSRAKIGLVPGWAVIIVGAIFNTFIFLLAVLTLKLKRASSEFGPLKDLAWTPIKDAKKGIKKGKRVRGVRKAIRKRGKETAPD